MNRYLPLTVGNRLKIIGLGTLEDAGLKSWNDPVLITGKTLFTKDTDAGLIPNTLSSFQKIVFDLQNETKKQVNGTVIYELDINIKKSGDQIKEKGEYFYSKNVDENISLSFIESPEFKNKDSVGVKINFNYEKAQGVLLLIVGKNESVFGNINIDLGSESTQMSYFYFDELNPGAKETVHIDIVDVAKDMMELKDIKRDDVFQRDDQDQNLYSTGKMLIKKTGGEFKDFKDANNIYRLISDVKDNAAVEGKQSYIEWEKDQNNISFITNPKLAYLRRNEILGKIKLKNKRKLSDPDNTNTLLNSIYKSFIQIASQNQEPKFFRIIFLVPNIYDQGKIRAVIESLNSMFNSDFVETYFFRQNKKRGDTIKSPVIECFAVSESDASLIASVNNKYGDKKIKKGKKILIIDSGKGTTDYSIINILSKNDFVCLKRGGVIGGGQYLTNSYLKSIACILLKHFDDNIVEEFYYEISKKKGREINDLMDILENLKKNEIRKNSQLSKLSLSNILKSEQVKNLSVTEDEIRKIDPKKDIFIQNDINRLINRILEDLLGEEEVLRGIDYIYLTGRAFLFTPYRKKIEQLLKRRISKNKYKIQKHKHPEIIFREIDSKSITVKLPKITSFKLNENSNLATSLFDSNDKTAFYEGFNNNNEERVYYVGEQTRTPLLYLNDEGEIGDYIEKTNLIKGDSVDNFDLQTLFGAGVDPGQRFKKWFIEEVKNVCTKRTVISEEDKNIVVKINGPYAGYANNPIAFSSLGSSGGNSKIKRCIWDFGDGLKSFELNTTHTYLQEGIYELKLTIENETGQSKTAYTKVNISNYQNEEDYTQLNF